MQHSDTEFTQEKGLISDAMLEPNKRGSKVKILTLRAVQHLSKNIVCLHPAVISENFFEFHYEERNCNRYKRYYDPYIFEKVELQFVMINLVERY